ncbi:MAG: histidine phosphatase family protein [Parachlamydiales bacterium]|nr:histidine phosphatase family protein [Parachlamydiales bacterium]
MNIYLMQHGISNPIEVDPEEGLKEDGKNTILNSARALKKINISFDLLLCSYKKRSIQTAEIIAKEFSYPESKIIKTEKVKPSALPQETIEFISQYERVFIAGHLPSIKAIISFLLSPSLQINIDIHNGGCTRIDILNNQAILKWSLTPDVLKAVIE